MTKRKTKAELISTYRKANQKYKQTLLNNNPKLYDWLTIEGNKKTSVGAIWSGRERVSFKW